MRRRETSPREGTGMGRLLRESSRRRPDPHGGVGRRRPSPSPLALRARYEDDGPTTRTKPSATTWAALVATAAEGPGSVEAGQSAPRPSDDLRLFVPTLRTAPVSP